MDNLKYTILSEAAKAAAGGVSQHRKSCLTE